MIRNIIFDWSGTLVDDLPAVWRASNYVLTQAGIDEITLEQFRAEFRLPFRLFYDRFTPHVPMAQLETWFHGHYRQIQDSVVALPHAREFLLFCRACQLRTFVLSSVHPDHFAAQAEQTDFAAFFDRCYVGVTDKRHVIHQILTENQLDPAATLFIGDMEHDMETARHGGVFSCGVLTGYNTLAQLRQSQPDLIVEHLGELQMHLTAADLQFPPAASNNGSQAQHPIVTVGGLIFDPADNVLMIRTRKWSDLWGIPGGKVKYGESCTAALLRELKEETNLDVTDVRFVMVQDSIHSSEFYRDAHFVLLNYTCRCGDQPEVKLNEEAVTYRWLPLRDAMALPLNQPTIALLNAVSQQLSAAPELPTRRAHG